MNRSILLLTTDLMVSSRVAGLAAAPGIEFHTVGTPEELQRRAPGRDLLILDLEAVGLNIDHLVPRLRSLSPAPQRIVAFGAHVHESLLAAARAAGCDEVLSRGQFFARLTEIARGAGLVDLRSRGAVEPKPAADRS